MTRVKRLPAARPHLPMLMGMVFGQLRERLAAEAPELRPSQLRVLEWLPAQAGTCDTNGVLGTAVGVMGTLQAQMVLSLLLDLTPSVAGRMTTSSTRR